MMETKPFWKSTNFWTNAIAVVLAIFAYLVEIPEAAAAEIGNNLEALKDAIFTKDLTQILIAAGSFANIIWHLFFKNRQTPGQ